MMIRQLFLIWHCQDPAVAVEMQFAYPPKQILDWYAKEYGLDREKLTWSLVDKIEYTGE